MEELPELKAIHEPKKSLIFNWVSYLNIFKYTFILA